MAKFVNNAKMPFVMETYLPLQHLIEFTETRNYHKLSSVVKLTSLEERLVAPRMDFCKIRELSYKKAQIGLTGTIINVPANLDKIQFALPRNLSNSMTVAIMLKIKMEYKNAYLSGNVCQKNVMTALKDLCNTSLYINEGIIINIQWEDVFDKSIDEHVVGLCNMAYHDSIDKDADLEVSHIDSIDKDKSLKQWYMDMDQHM
jgi:hypothetical protein